MYKIKAIRKKTSNNAFTKTSMLLSYDFNKMNTVKKNHIS